MATYGSDERADQTIALRAPVKKRLEAARSYPREPFWSIVSRLLDEHETLHSKPSEPPREALPA